MADDEIHEVPSKQGWCPECARPFEEPVVREIDGDFVNLACHYPLCDYQFAKWPKDETKPFKE